MKHICELKNILAEHFDWNKSRLTVLYKSRFNLTDNYFKIVFNNISSDFSLLSVAS
jgi:hypothetical protein